MNAAREIGMTEVASTKPMSRAERRAEAARIRAAQEAQVAMEQQTDQSDDAEVPDPPTAAPATAAPARSKSSAGAVGLPMKKARKRKGPFATQIRTETIDRLAWATNRGASLTDMTDTALTEYLDRAGVPVPDENGRMPEN